MKIACVIPLASLLAVLVHIRADESQRPAAVAGSETKGYRNVRADEFDKLRSDKKNVVLDVRTPQEFKAGHIAGALNIDWNSSDFEKKVSELDKNKTYLVHCQGGVRSAKASDKLMKLNFKSVVNLEGGMKAWEKAGKPVEKGEK